MCLGVMVLLLYLVTHPPPGLRAPCPLLRSYRDLADSFPRGQLKPLFFSPWIEKLLIEVKTDAQASIQTKEVGKWTREMVKRQISSA